MVKKIFALLVCFIGLTIFFVSMSHSQGSMKTITLPNGEVIWDLNGEWDVWVELYGPWQTAGSYSQIYKITQEGSSVVAVRMMDDPSSTGRIPNQKGSQSLRGELDKNGFKKVQLINIFGPLDAKGQISEDGNRMVIDDGVKARVTYTRKK